MVKLPDGREGTVVYHGLDGYGIRWGRLQVDVDAILAANPVMDDPVPAAHPLVPQAMLREKTEYSAKIWPGMECVGEDYEVVT